MSEMAENCVFIINPVAGTENATARLIPQIEAAAKQAGISVKIEQTKHAGHARELAEQYAKSGQPVRIYACGGDGTLNEVVQAAAGAKNIAVGCVPCGSGNDFVRNFGTAEGFLNIAAQLDARVVPIDLIETNYGYGVAICAAGLDAQVAYGIPKFRRIPGCGGSTAYTLSILQVLFSRFGHKLRIKLDDTTITDTYMMMAICNGRLYGGGYMAGPLAVMNDGIFDIVLVKPISRLKIAGFLSKYKAGAHLLPDGTVIEEFSSFMQSMRAKSVDVEVLDGKPIIITVDGECRPTEHLHVAVSDKKLNILLPKDLIGRTTAINGQQAAETIKDGVL